ncbi:glycosyltransferase family 4 protein [Parabacteroides sp. FAFU027]|uniref:glycosyltransferase family 4 protein n=1 Tax=Parabacteroides sp. FAFU027 TaxID=2922715 RepID=UPI001FAFDAD9|nr:glycosyltransferase family 4 protein [Parabacteroides sp. FAFU027]
MGVVFCLNDIDGGVYSVVKNIVKYGNFDSGIKIILAANLHNVAEGSRIKPDLSIQAGFVRFEYNKGDNFYYIARRFKRLIDSTDIIVANDWLELGVVSNLGLQNKVIFILHGDYDYYYDLAIKHQKIIDAFICVSECIQLKLQESLSDRSLDIVHLRHPIPSVPSKQEYNYGNKLRCLFIGRLTKDKGYHILPLINAELKQKGVFVEWGIVGNDQNVDRSAWNEAKNVNFLGQIENSVLLSRLRQYDLFLLPSHAEGFPVSLVECMKAGLVPLLSDLPSGIPELVEHGITGYRFPLDDYIAYVNVIEQIHNQRELLSQMGKLCQVKTQSLFDPKHNAQEYLSFIYRVAKYPCRIKHREKIYGSRLDQPYLFNVLTRLVRKYINI